MAHILPLIIINLLILVNAEQIEIYFLCLETMIYIFIHFFQVSSTLALSFCLTILRWE